MKNMNLYTVWIPLILGVVGTIIAVLELFKDDKPQFVVVSAQGNQVVNSVPQNQTTKNTQQNQQNSTPAVNTQQNQTQVVIPSSESSQAIVVTPVTVIPATVEATDWKKTENFSKLERDFKNKYEKNEFIREYERRMRSLNSSNVKTVGRCIANLEKFEQSEENLTEQEIFCVALLKSFAMLKAGQIEITRIETAKKFNIDNTPVIKDYLQKCIDYDPNGSNGKFGQEATKLLKDF